MIGLIPRLLALLMISVAAASGAVTFEPSNVTPPKPAREFRAAWIASVGNIVWPSKSGLSSAEQKRELVAILDRAVELRLNALILQVRPACDALYASKLEPWSEYLTGVMGQAPKPFYDPLAFAVEEAHQRGLELHAWFNPYRARHLPSVSPVAATHVSKTHPQWVRQYGKQLWLDPGDKGVQAHSLAVVMDVVKRYDIDGVHIDDYFYPYKEHDESGRELDFPDGPSWQRSGAEGKLSRDDWRRENVNVFIERLYREMKTLKPWVKFGVSPFGIWRPGNPPQIEGFDAYAKLYADSRKWIAEGWLDYLVPQLYWGIEPREQSFPALLKWWAGENPKKRHLWPGMDTTKTSGKWKPEEIINQIRITRKQNGVDGHVHWNMKSLMGNAGLDSALLSQVYSEPALVPASSWLGPDRPGRPALSADHGRGGNNTFHWTPASGHKPWLWLVQTCSAGQWKIEILPASKSTQTWSVPPEIVAISAIDRNANASPPAALALRK
jgi:uncharacterized lipoprotein YddW (UPF0748 family)